MASTYTNLLYHLVFSTKHRIPLITDDLRPELYAYIGGIIRNKRGVMLEIGGMPDHVHIVAKLKADMSVAEATRFIKSNSSKCVNEKPGRRARFEWQTGYGAFTVSESQIEIVRQYVRGQAEHHRKITFQEEFVQLLKQHGIEYDERYLWD